MVKNNSKIKTTFKTGLIVIASWMRILVLAA
jgi:hypothetical protein